ncbi:uncharacterized protein LOC110970234 [Acanthochromis polyacanthus]|uniref:Uncharacterized LOC110970234 n=1 Tax=Acanthochromis polyacanthus TaxID=80966 RepID=A0A3Q1FVM3_9TELE|nr:uncharacterized protein LOC110970234 [Acanthochromis polyacanthus]
MMGNVVKKVHEFARSSLWRSGSVQDVEPPPEGRLLRELEELQEVELWRLHWCLSQNLQPDVPPIPPHWLHSADACSTAKTMVRCYQEDGALVMLAAARALIGHDDQDRHPHHTAGPAWSRPALTPNPDFIKSQRRRLISRIQRPGQLLETLLKDSILNTTNTEAVSIYASRQDKNRALVDLVLRTGVEAQRLFCQALSQSEPFLIQELQDRQIRSQNASETSAVMEMLDLLVSDELRLFQWLVSDHMTAEDGHLIGGEQLQNADRPTTARLLKDRLGPEQAESVTMTTLLKIFPSLRVCLKGAAVTSQASSDIRVETNVPPVEITPKVHEKSNVFRLCCQQPAVVRCSLTGLLLEGCGDLLYQMVPWDLDFLASKGLRPAGPLFRFHLLSGRFHRLHLPHSRLPSGGGKCSMSVAHVTGDCVDFITPGQVTDSHLIVDISGFSCFGLVESVESGGAIHGLVLLFSQPASSKLYVLLLPRNICLSQVRKEWKRRIGAEYVETIPNCELIPNQTYKLYGEPVTGIQPEISKFINFSDYNNFLPSFEVQLPAGVTMVKLQLMSHVTPHRLISWLFGPKESDVWTRDITLSAPVLRLRSMDATQQLIQVLDCLHSEDLKAFQRLLTLQSDPIPVCRLEAADRTSTVDLMVQKYRAEGAVQVTEEILRQLNYNQLAEELLS